jgi:hypothetical protein
MHEPVPIWLLSGVRQSQDYVGRLDSNRSG